MNKEEGVQGEVMRGGWFVDCTDSNAREEGEDSCCFSFDLKSDRCHPSSPSPHFPL